MQTDDPFKLSFEDFDCTNGLPDGFSDWDNYYCALTEFRKQEIAQQREQVREKIEKLSYTYEHEGEIFVPEESSHQGNYNRAIDDVLEVIK